jgi:hypothetical protein
MKKESTFPKIDQDQYLGEQLQHIPTDVIFFKLIPGLGVTTLEIEDQSRNSIIIEPNVPVIVGKCGKYNTRHTKTIRGVYEGKTVDDIVDYLRSSVTPKKIITTPESFLKVKEAMKDEGIDMYKDYFIVFDECERTIQDVGYRTKILIPVDDFFHFNGKAFVSATPIAPSDPRFVEHGFTPLYIEPTFEYKEPIKLIHTNNVFSTVEKYFEENPKDQYFIFFNSTDSIAYLINHLKIKDESSIYCAKESMQRLKVNHFTNVYTSLKSFRKYNFLTSRFFSAVDIDNIANPTILIVSDILFAEHSMIDPFTEAVQIIGRFRKEKGAVMTKDITHITNTNPELYVKTEEEVYEYIKQWQIIYEFLHKYRQAATNVIAREVLTEMIEQIDFAKYLNPDGSINYFMQDNTLFEERVKSFYQEPENLLAAYTESKRFVIEKENETYEFTDEDRIKVQRKTAPMRTVFEVVMPIIADLHEEGKYTTFHREYQLSHLSKDFPDVVNAFNRIGLAEAQRLNFDVRKIRKAIKEMDKLEQLTSFGFVKFIKETIRVGMKLSSNAIYAILRRGLKENNLHLLTPTKRLLDKYCKLSNRKWIGVDNVGNDIQGYEVLEVYNNQKKNYLRF